MNNNLNTVTEIVLNETRKLDLSYNKDLVYFTIHKAQQDNDITNHGS